MEQFIDALVRFFTFRPLVLFYWLLLGFLAAWLLAFVLSRLQIGTQEKAGRVVHVDEAAYKAWSVSLLLHLIAAAWILVYLFYDYFVLGGWLGVGDWIYLVFYMLLVLADFVLVLFLKKRWTASKEEWKQLDIIGR